jgi:predicted membrane-bound spermidine synthase
MKYPCIVYNKTGKNRHFANDVIYLSQQGYGLTVIETDPDSKVADDIESHFQHCTIDQHFTADNLNHTSLSLYY